MRTERKWSATKVYTEFDARLHLNANAKFNFTASYFLPKCSRASSASRGSLCTRKKQSRKTREAKRLRETKRNHLMAGNDTRTWTSLSAREWRTTFARKCSRFRLVLSSSLSLIHSTLPLVRAFARINRGRLGGRTAFPVLIYDRSLRN